MIPPRPWVFSLLSEKRVPPHIIRHSLRVRMAAVFIAHALRERGEPVDIRLVDRASILHDICKAESLEHGGDHARMGQELLESRGYGRVGDVIGQHIRLKTLQVNEAMIVNYADKRVMHERVVSIERRFLDLMDRYGREGENTERILMHFAHVIEIEQAVVRASGIDPARLGDLNLIPGDHPLYGGHGLL